MARLPRSGLSLLENIAAVVILAAGFVVILAVLFQDLHQIRDDSRYSTACFLSGDRLATALADGYTNLTSETSAMVPDYPGYSHEVIVVQVSDTDFSTEVVWTQSSYRRVRVSVKAFGLPSVEVSSVCAEH
ncbi:MAG: hypothetical protein PHQ23_06800 [Candidatus Wallbacteria bacterium]|nr:hypothetical protein [Candidatus Wallbacteria bacterium]